jgi:hypothetical protein
MYQDYPNYYTDFNVFKFNDSYPLNASICL